MLVWLWHNHLSLSYWGIFPWYENHSHLAAADAIKYNYWVYVYVGATTSYCRHLHYIKDCLTCNMVRIYNKELLAFIIQHQLQHQLLKQVPTALESWQWQWLYSVWAHPPDTEVETLPTKNIRLPSCLLHPSLSVEWKGCQDMFWQLLHFYRFYRMVAIGNNTILPIWGHH